MFAEPIAALLLKFELCEVLDRSVDACLRRSHPTRFTLFTPYGVDFLIDPLKREEGGGGDSPNLTFDKTSADP